MLLEKFTKIFNELFDAEKISKNGLARKADVQCKSILNWLNGKSYPRYDSLVKLANYFEVTTDYLLGLEKESLTETFCENPINDIPNIFRTRLKGLLTEKDMTEYRLAKLLKIGQSAITKWLHEASMPETTILIGIASVFDCTVDFLLGRIS